MHNDEILKLAEMIKERGMGWGILEFLQDDIPALITACDALASARHEGPLAEWVIYVFHDDTQVLIWDGVDAEAF